MVEYLAGAYAIGSNAWFLKKVYGLSSQGHETFRDKPFGQSEKIYMKDFPSMRDFTVTSTTVTETQMMLVPMGLVLVPRESTVENKCVEGWTSNDPDVRLRINPSAEYFDLGKPLNAINGNVQGSVTEVYNGQGLIGFSRDPKFKTIDVGISNKSRLNASFNYNFGRRPKFMFVSVFLTAGALAYKKVID